jgi:sulfotransferase
MGLRHNLSDNDFWLAQLDADFELSYQRLLNAFRSFMNGWFTETDKTWVVDKNRGWLQHIETVHHLDPNFKILVCVRELGQIYGSIEAQHQKTLLLDFPDHLASLSRYDRADTLFGKNGVVGAPLKSIEALQDIAPELQQHLFYVVFEHLMSEPSIVLNNIFQWLGIAPCTLDWQNLAVEPHESDSYYRYKYRHRTYSTLQAPQKHQIPQRIQKDLQKNFTWFYQIFYPGLLPSA